MHLVESIQGEPPQHCAWTSDSSAEVARPSAQAVDRAGRKRYAAQIRW